MGIGWELVPTLQVRFTKLLFYRPPLGVRRPFYPTSQEGVERSTGKEGSFRQAWFYFTLPTSLRKKSTQGLLSVSHTLEITGLQVKPANIFLSQSKFYIWHLIPFPFPSSADLFFSQLVWLLTVSQTHLSLWCCLCAFAPAIPSAWNALTSALLSYSSYLPLQAA